MFSMKKNIPSALISKAGRILAPIFLLPLFCLGNDPTGVSKKNELEKSSLQKQVMEVKNLLASQGILEVAPWLAIEALTGAHDPTVIRDDRGVYTLMTTNNLLQLRQSTDMVKWTTVGQIFTSVPTWINTTLNTTSANAVTDIWAPHISYRAGKYWVYYCGSSFGTNNSAIGVATNPTLDVNSPNYKWTDLGEVIKTSTSNNYNAIDPELITDNNGNVWLAFGSFWTGIKMVAIDPSTGKRLASNSTVYSLANRGGSGIEGPSMMYHNGYYFLFTSWDACCNGVNSTYRTMVGRSTLPNSGYVDKNGTSLANNASLELLKGYGRYFGPGGGSPFKDGRRDYYAHHYYNGNENGTPRLQIREIVWDENNWPVLTQPFLGRRLSYEAEHALLTSATISTNSNASNKEYIGDINATASKVVFYITAFAAGDYNLRIHYSAANAAATQLLQVNGGTAITVQYPKTPAAGQFPTGQSVSIKVTLKEGTNNLSFIKGSGLSELDKIDLIRIQGTKLEGGAMDNGVGVTYVATNNNGSLLANSWLMFENVDFSSGGLKSLTIALANAGISQFKIALDGQNGSVNSTFGTDASNKSKAFALPQNFQTATGIHDVYLTLLSGACELDYLQFNLSDVVTGLDDMKETQGLAVFPNPSSSYFTVVAKGHFTYTILDATGKEVESGHANDETRVGMNLPAGMYAVQIQQIQQQKTISIIKK
jgi:arabinan endo-1,5-alpha-L-arabinosidase